MRSVGSNLSETYEAEPESVGRARAAIAKFAADAGATRGQIDDIRLATSEAVTNSVLHAYRGCTGSIQLTAAIVSDELWVLIADDGCGMQPRSDGPGLGLGLGLISQVSDDLAIAPRSSGGTELRMRFPLEHSERSRRTCATPRGARDHQSSPTSSRR
ncbi:MAG: ATP-binding protein [Solirubrobacteraceae bacterium]